MEKKKKTEAIPYDGEKLRYQIESHNYTMSGLSLELGYSRTYFGNIVNHNKGIFDIPVRVVKLLELVGIHYEDYKPDPEPVEEQPLPWDVYPEVDPPFRNLTGKDIEALCKAMHETIYDAVYEAVKKAWSE